MKYLKIMNFSLRIILFTLLIVGVGCNSSEENNHTIIHSSNTSKLEQTSPREFSSEFNDYWHSGKDEVTSYQLSQERYGELREGTAVTIFVTEDFLVKEQVKANTISEENLTVLKLNQTKNFNTGIYPYSIMSSTFSPVYESGHALKISSSIQEWCGQMYMQLNNKKDFEIESHSYFEGEADQKKALFKTWLENELWNVIRINPEELPIGDLLMIPSFEYLQMRHKEIKAHSAFATIKQGDDTTVYTVNYPELQRQLVFYFNNIFPYEIEKWEEVNAAAKNDTIRLRTSAVKMKRMNIDYWTKNKNEFKALRDSLNLK